MKAASLYFYSKLSFFLLLSCLLLLTISCSKETDKDDNGQINGNSDYEFNEKTITEALDELTESENIYNTVLQSDGRIAAALSAREYLLGLDITNKADTSEDLSVWVMFKNGLFCSIVDETFDRTVIPVKKSAESQAGYYDPMGGEVTPSSVILAPFKTELPHTDPANVVDLINECLGGPVPATEVFENSDVTVNKVRDVMESGTGLLIWAGHGSLLPSDTAGGPDICALLTGESYAGTNAMKTAIIEKYGDQVKAGSNYLAITRHKSKFYISILPGFVTTHGNFNVLEGMGVNQAKCLAYISCCFSLRGMPDAFAAAGTDTYLGWSIGVRDTIAGAVDRGIIRLAADTSTIQEAYDEVDNTIGISDPEKPRSKLYLRGDRNLIIRAQMRMNTDGKFYRGYSVGIHEGSPVSVGCFTGTNQTLIQYSAGVNIPAPQTGSWDCVNDTDAEIIWNDLYSGKSFIVSKEYVGVSGSIDVTDYGDDLIRITFSGTLGRWTHTSPTEDPPEETVTISNGFVKYTGIRQ